MIPESLLRGGLGYASSAFWVGGMDSSRDPVFLQETEYRSSMNVVNRGGVIKTRPGYECIFELPPGRLQGFTTFRPSDGPWQLVVAVAGQVFHSAYPFTSYSRVPNIQFFPGSDIVTFESTVKTVTQNPDGTLSIIDPQNILVMQDGRTAAAFWDGSTGRHLVPANGETPMGLWMKWSGDRLWVARGSELFAGDIADPLRFTETGYLAEGGSFKLPDRITAMAEIASVDAPQLLVFTDNTTSVIQSNVRNRELWKSIENFQRVLLPGVGCVSGRAIGSQYGQLWWMTPTGITSLNAALSSRVSSELIYRDTAMAVSKGNLSPNIDKVAVGVFENYLLFSAPSGDLFNRHTWVMDQSVGDTLSGRMAPAWNSIWTGTRPVEWSTASINGVQRIFHASVDYDGKNRIWESFIPTREDNGQPITCYVETKSHANFNDLAQGLDIKTFQFAELEFTEIQGTLDLKVYWAGLRGNYKQLTVFRFVAPNDSITASKIFTLDSNLFSFRPQSRIVRTTSVLEDPQELSACNIESSLTDRHDRAFSLLLVWSGKAALRSYRLFARKFDESGVGAQKGLVEEVEGAPSLRQGLVDKENDCRAN